jgi:hypothetical protein
MRKITSMTFALGALLVAAVAARADDLQIATTLRQVGSIQIGAPSLSELNNAVYGAYAESRSNTQSRRYAQDRENSQKTCNYEGGQSRAWVCW